MRKFFLAFSVLVLIVLITIGVHQKIVNTNVKDIKGNELGIIYFNHVLR